MGITQWSPFQGCRADKEMRCRRGDGRGSSGKGNEVMGGGGETNCDRDFTSAVKYRHRAM